MTRPTTITCDKCNKTFDLNAVAYNNIIKMVTITVGSTALDLCIECGKQVIDFVKGT
jgi:hypothetical protein